LLYTALSTHDNGGWLWMEYAFTRSRQQTQTTLEEKPGRALRQHCRLWFAEGKLDLFPAITTREMIPRRIQNSYSLPSGKSSSPFSMLVQEKRRWLRLVRGLQYPLIPTSFTGQEFLSTRLFSNSEQPCLILRLQTHINRESTNGIGPTQVGLFIASVGQELTRPLLFCILTIQTNLVCI